MAKIAYILLCHTDPMAVIAQARRLTARGDFIAIHFDARAGEAAFAKIHSALGKNEQVALARRAKCGWGEWSLVQATLNAIDTALTAFPSATHFYMVSGDCMPIKSAGFIHAFLDRDDKDYIESFDYFKSYWIKTGMREERLIYRHFVNERKHKKLFYASIKVQKKLGLGRAIPRDLEIMIGSQWWCLRRATILSIVDFLKKRKDILRFFKRTWIPDETFFQTLVRHLVPHAEIDPRTLTFLMFSDYGMPVIFYNDQYDLLLSQEFMFARKISPDAMALKARLGALYASEQTDFVNSNEGRKLHHYLTQQGRHGRRFAPRAWEHESTLGREREILVLICKKWNVAKRLLKTLRDTANLCGVEFLFDEENTSLPRLGGIESSMIKRTRHRRAMTRLIFDFFETDRLVICLDPGNLDLLKDFYSDRCTTKILEIECNFDDAYLIRHAKRVGLAGDTTSPETLAALLPTIRQEFAHQTDVLRDSAFANHYRLSENNSDDENAVPLSAFLGIPADMAVDIVDAHHLFAE